MKLPENALPSIANLVWLYAFCEEDDVDADDNDGIGVDVGVDAFAPDFDKFKNLNFLNWFSVDELKWTCEQSKSN